MAQTDVTSQYITNADFSSTEGWTAEVSSQFKDYGNGLIGTYGVRTAEGQSVSTVDDTHLATEYCFGFEVRWSSNFAAFTQTTSELPIGVYTLTFDVEDTNPNTTKATYENRFFVQIGDSKTTDSSTEWMAAGKSSWTTHTISFNVTSPVTATISLGYGTGSNNFGSKNTPTLHVSHLKLTWTDPEAAAHAAALEAAKYTLNGYIKKATALNGILADATLTTAIATAQEVYNAATDWAEDYDNTVNASTTLNTAITTALSGATVVALNNGNFDTTPNNTLDGDGNTVFGGTLSTATSNPDNTKDMSANTGDHGYLYDVTGWTQYSKFNSTASQGTTSEYGTAMPANGWSTNSTTPPATDMFGGTDGAALHLSAGWNDQARYMQQIDELPSGRYVFYYEVINLHSNTGIASNYTGVSGEASDFYGTSNSFVYSNLNSLEQGVWKAQAFEFDVAKTSNIKFFVGVTTSTGGSGNGAKLWVDNVLVYRIGDITMTDEEANAILAEVEALDEVAFNATDKSALAAAKSTFESSKTIDNYNALNTALVAAQSSVTVYTALDAAITNIEGWTSDATTVTAPIRAKYTAGEYSNETVADDIYAEYQAAEIAALAAASAINYTSAIINPSFETGDITGWTAENRNDTGVKENSNGTYTTSGVDGKYLFNSWGGTAENNVYQTIKDLPAGTYTLSALLAGFNGESLVLAANATTNSVTVAGDKTTGYTVNVVFTLADAADVVIKASNTKSQDGSDASFIKADNFRLTAGDVTTNDYTALNAAIDATNDKVLGFDEGEYAPYNNVAALTALKAAKAVDQSVAMSQTDLDAIVNALTSATWTANATEVNAFYDGNFTIQPEHTTGPTALVGWNNPQGIRQLIKNTETYPGLTSATGQAAVFAWGNTTMFYGETEGYTLPLNAHTIYELSFKTCGWIDGDMGYVNVDIKNANNEGLQTKATATATKRINEENPWDEFKVIFETGEAGNYKFGMWTSKHTTFTDLVLKKAVAVPVTIDETVAYTPAETFANVTLKRSFKLGQWNTFVVPFDIPVLVLTETFGANVEIAEYSENSEDANNVTVNFNKMENLEIKANTPVLIKPTDESLQGGEIFFNAFMIKTGEAKVEGKNFDFVGTYAPATIVEGDYFISGDKLYKSAGATNIKGTRAYLKAKGDTSGEVKLFIDGLETAISEINGDAAEQGAIYNLAGQRVEKAQKGIYIVNGKKVVVK